MTVIFGTLAQATAAHLGTILGNSFSFIVSTNHKSYRKEQKESLRVMRLMCSHLHQGTEGHLVKLYGILPVVSHPNKIFICEIRPKNLL